MPTWGEILSEFGTSPNTPDSIRRKYLSGLAKYTGRDTILYSTKWTDPSGVSPDAISITEEDIQGFMEVVHGLRNTNLDLIIHSPGGSPVATEAIVKYLRKKFTNIRTIVPQGAMSAGAILDQFELAKKECKDNQNLDPWLPILSQYGPGLLIECKNAIALSRKLVQNWLAEYMFHGTQRASYTASFAAKRLASHQDHKSHARHLDREDCKKIGLIIDDLEQDQTLQDLVLSVFHASTLTFNITPTAKIIENQNGKAFIKLSGTLTRVPSQPQIPLSFQPQDLPQIVEQSR